MTKIRLLSEFNIKPTGGGVAALINSAIDSLDEGSILIFDAASFAGSGSVISNEYSIFRPILINKSISIVGDSPAVKIVNKAPGNIPTFLINPSGLNFYFGLENLTIVSGTIGLSISGTATSALTTIKNVQFFAQLTKSINIQTSEVNCHIDNVFIDNSPQYGIYIDSDTCHDNFSLKNSKVKGTTVAGLYWTKPNLGSGSVYITETEFINNNQAIVVNNLRYYEHNVEYINNAENYILSGASIRLTGSAGGGAGVTAHGALTGLSNDDHKIYLHVSGTREMSANLGMGAHDIVNVGLVDGVDVSVMSGVTVAHIQDLNNPHATSIVNIGAGTLAQLNAAISDADVVSEANFNLLSATVKTLSGTFQSFSASVQAATGTLFAASASFATVSASFSPLSNSFSAISASYVNASASFATTSASFSPLSNSFAKISASFVGFSSSHASRHLSGATDPIDAQALRGDGLSINRLLITDGLGGWTTVASQSVGGAGAGMDPNFYSFSATIQSFTASVQVTTGSLLDASASFTTVSASFGPLSNSFAVISASYKAFSASHGVNHKSGGIDPLDVQSLRGDSVAINRLLISDGLGGWTTVASQSVGTPPGAPAAHASTHLSGASDPINIQYMQASGAAGNMLVMTSGTANASLVLVASSTFALQTDFANASASFASLSTSFSPLSNSFAAISASYINSSASFATVSSSFSPLSNSFGKISASFVGFSGSHGSRHLSGAVDALDAQSLGGSGLAIDRLLITNGLGGWTTVASSSIKTAPGSHATTHLSGGTDPLNVQLMQASGVAGNMIFMTSGTANGSIVTIASSTFALQIDFTSASSSFASVSSSFSPLSLSFAAISASYINSSASFATVSSSWSPLSSSFTKISASFIGFSSSHASRHTSGAADPINVQFMQASGVAVNSFFMSSGSGDASIVMIATSTFTLQTDFTSASSSFAAASRSFSPLSNSFAAISASYTGLSATYSPLSNSFATISASYINSSASFAAVSASWSPLSNSFGPISASFVGFSSSHASRHLSGAADPIDAQSLRGDGLAVNRLLITNAAGGWTTVASSSLSLPAAPHAATHLSGASDPINVQFMQASGAAANMIFMTSGTANGSIVTIASSTFALQTDFTSVSSSFATVSASFSPLSNSFAAISASYVGLSATYSPLSNSFAAISASFINSSASFATVSSSFSPLSNSFAKISASFIGFSGSHALRHLSGGADPLNVQLMQASGVAGNMIFMTSGTANASIVTIASSTFALQVDFSAVSASFASVSSSWSPLSNSFAAISASYTGLSATYSPLSNSFAAISASYINSSASFATVSSSFSPLSSSFAKISASFIGFSGSHASRHLSGGADPIDAQSLRGDGIATNDRLLISNGLGGWTTVLSTSVGTPPGIPGAHANTHLSGGTDPLNVQLMQASGVAGNMIFMTSGTANASIVTIASSTFALQTDFGTLSSTFAGVSGTYVDFVTSATFEGYTLISGTQIINGNAYIKNLVPLTAGVGEQGGAPGHDYLPIELSATDTAIYIKRTPPWKMVYLFDDFTNFPDNALLTSSFGNLGWTGRANNGIIRNFSANNSNNQNNLYMGSAIGTIQLSGAARGSAPTISFASASFALGYMTSSEMEFRLVSSGSTTAGTTESRVQFGWLNNNISGTTPVLSEQTNGVYFEHTSSTNFWRICAASASTYTRYTTSQVINSASFGRYTIIITGSLAPTASFYVNDALIGVISSTMPVNFQPIFPGVKILNLTGSNARSVIIDYFELSYQLDRNP